jgi:hypothetical protein
MASTWNDASVIAAVNAIAALGNSGTLQIYTGASPGLNASLTGTLLASLPLSATAFATATASAGTVTAVANAITSAAAAATGTAGYFAIVKSGASTPPTGAQTVLIGTVGTSGANLNLSSLAITSGATVSCSSFSLTCSETGT